MNKLYSLCFSLLIATSLSLGGMSEAQAKRFGGASSFGSKPSYSKSYDRSKTSQPAQQNASQNQASQQNQTARQSMAKRGGLMGLLGGLALGGLLGSLLFGGAFENINFMDILLFGGVALLLYKLFAAKAAKTATNANSYARNHYQETPEEATDNSYQRNNQTTAPNAGFNTDILFNKDKTNNAPAFEHTEKPLEGAMVLPKDFNEQDFLDGAKAAFRMLQQAWDEQDLADIRSLTTDKVFAEIQTQIKAMTGTNHTDVLKIDAELLEIRTIGNELEAVVLFDTLMREEQHEHPSQVREVWTFIKPVNSQQSKWYLDGLQQLAD